MLKKMASFQVHFYKLLYKKKVTKFQAGLNCIKVLKIILIITLDIMIN